MERNLWMVSVSREDGSWKSERDVEQDRSILSWGTEKKNDKSDGRSCRSFSFEHRVARRQRSKRLRSNSF